MISRYSDATNDFPAAFWRHPPFVPKTRHLRVNEYTPLCVRMRGGPKSMTSMGPTFTVPPAPPPRACLTRCLDSFCDSGRGSVRQGGQLARASVVQCWAEPRTPNFSGALHAQRSLVSFFDLVCGVCGHLAVRTSAPTTSHSSLNP
jgi:hypothetical protein